MRWFPPQSQIDDVIRKMLVSYPNYSVKSIVDLINSLAFKLAEQSDSRTRDECVMFGLLNICGPKAFKAIFYRGCDVQFYTSIHENFFSLENGVTWA